MLLRPSPRLLHHIIRRKHAWTSKKIRSSFIEFFEKEDHTFVPSSSVIPHNDPSLITVNAGMNQFKPIFLDQLTPDHPFAGIRRAVNSQKCIRCGGKHNDLQAVGRDMRHHTFFEMLGNWSFGDYGKQEAIHMSWRLLTDVFKLDPSRIVITYFAGDEAANLGADSESEEIWRSIISSSGRNPSIANNGSRRQPLLMSMGSEDNFWEMGFTGPCGPCTEIHYLIDRPSHESGHAPLDVMSNAIEIWNLVFMQFNRMSDGSLQPLSKQHVDTGMGLERIAAILQSEKQTSNYDTDLFIPLFEVIQRKTGVRPYTGLLHDPLDTCYRIIADHARMYTVAIADGLLPDQRDAGHKLRSIIRSAHFEVVESFGLYKPLDLMTALSDAVSESLGEAYPEIYENLTRVKEVVSQEVDTFSDQMRKARQSFKRIAKDKVRQQNPKMSGQEAVVLYKRFGCPIRLLQQLGSRYSIEIDFAAFHQILREEHERSVQSSGIKEGVNSS